MKKETFTVTIDEHSKEFIGADEARDYIASLPEDHGNVFVHASIRDVENKDEFDQTPRFEDNYDQTRGTSP